MNISIKLVTIYLLIALATACSIGGKTKPSQYYVLDAQIKEATATNLNSVRLGVGPIAIPGYIDRPQMVTKMDSGELLLDEFARWAEPMSEMVTRTLTQNIRALTESQQIHSHPWIIQLEFDYQFKASVIKFENNNQGDALLIVRWGLIDESDSTDWIVVHSEFKASASNSSQSARVAALNATLAQFAREVVNRLQ